MQEHIGDLLSLTRGILVHGCNCQGKMGAGFAALIRKKWSDVYTSYTRKMSEGGLRLGDIQVICSAKYSGPSQGYQWIDLVSEQLPKDLVVVNALTQFWYGREKNVQYADDTAIFAAFARVRGVALATGLPVHFPPVGCSLGGRDWSEIRPIIEAALGPKVEAHVWRLD